MKRKKNVYSNIHATIKAWATQKGVIGENFGRNPTRHIYFRENRIYSYGEHFEIARIINNVTVFITTKTYSVTTARHINAVNHGALRYFRYIFTVPTFDNHKANVEYYQQQARITSEKAQHARYPHTKARYEDRGKSINTDCQLYKKLFCCHEDEWGGK